MIVLVLSMPHKALPKKLFTFNTSRARKYVDEDKFVDFYLTKFGSAVQLKVLFGKYSPRCSTIPGDCFGQENDSELGSNDRWSFYMDLLGGVHFPKYHDFFKLISKLIVTSLKSKPKHDL